ncbi:MAG TPA: DUF1846 domain-containing protein [Candidatus Borkfalkia excrementavium]|uniref:DUF1846 domain-containing protein n=1 Tax=Candidatus Borkfalkia excrementavium TaxID=2838505 RepID=A0A9D1Z9Q3_9FIRM|nr:DUF1846 domain-containing protein [Candidatus Borkfalkia excrementavium]
MKKGFDNDLYIRLQGEKILERIKKFDNKLYLEFGGKLFDDMHATRVLPGFEADAKCKMLLTLKDQSEIIFVISAADLERNKIRADFGIPYGTDVLRLIDKLRGLGLNMNSVVVTQYLGQPAADKFVNKLERHGLKTYIHRKTKGYPTEVDVIVSDEGYGANPYIETKKPLVVVTAPGPGSGKLATCLSQLYHEYKRGVRAGYAKFETFPIWNLPLRHPVNVAYEAATADLGDINMIDPYHLETYGQTTVNYNRDIECFPIVKSILTKITGDDSLYHSPTDMGVNMAGFAIVDDEICRAAARQEIIRRYYKAACDYKTGNCGQDTVERILLLMNQNKISQEERSVVRHALEKAEKTGSSAVAVELSDGRTVTGRSSKLMSACSSAVLNAVKALSNIDDEMLLLSPIILAPIIRLKKEVLGEDKVKLSLGDVLTALSICAATNPIAEKALDMLVSLRGCEAHASCILPESDMSVVRKLGINLTCEPEFGSKDLYGF